MTKPTTITLAAMRGKVRRIHPRVLIANTLLFQVASVLVAALWSAIVCGFNGWGVLPGLLMGAGAAGATASLWLMGSLGWMLQSGVSGVQRMTRGWVVSLILVSLVGALVATPFWAAIAAAAVGLGLMPVLAKMARSVEETKVTSWGMPKAFLPALQGIPEHLPPQVDSILSLAFQDWMHLRDLVGFTAESALRSYVDMTALLRDAERTVLYLLRRAPVAAKLVVLSNERGELTARRAAETALQRMRRVGEVLHEAVAAASQFAASEEREEAHELKIRVDGLKELAESLEFDGLEVEISRTSEDAQRLRVGQGTSEPGMRVAVQEPEAQPQEVPVADDEEVKKGSV
ncbi:MAG TPA: hypothetical protein PKL73_24840 [Polyangiaceae bacterium]|nr:hypothetical protein [Polyangiaceae bacterium]